MADFEPFASRMQADRQPKVFIETFAYYYERLVAGDTGMIPEADIRPVASLPDLEAFPQTGIVRQTGDGENGRYQTQWRPGNQHGIGTSQIIAAP
ncbi:MAG: hypothetical protein M5U34_38805 [Chloroflexi bacterium]|nr:hypothetical protein [Chloroflexota bacterium]